MGGKDIMEKTLEAYNDVFADIVNGLLFQGRTIIAPDSLVDAQPYSFYKADGKLHEQERDVSKYSQRMHVRIALLGFENQSDIDVDMALRVFGYDGASYRAQLDGKDRYPVVTLVLYFGEKRWKKRNLFDVVDVPDIWRPYVNDYRINVFEIAYLSDEQIAWFTSDFQVVADYFAHRRVNKDYRPTNPKKFDHANEVLKLMGAIAHDHRFEELINPKGGTPEDMCEVLDRVEERGIAIGEERGEKRGALRKAKETALNLRSKGRITDPVEVASIVNVEAELVERWFEEEKA